MLSPNTQFWWNWSVQALTALGTVGAVLVALFTQWIKARLLPPQLSIRLHDPLGDPSPAAIQRPDGNTHLVPSRWYHIDVDNRRRALAPAAGVQVFLQRLEVFDAAVGQYRVSWFGEMPLRWKTQEVKPIALTIGRPDGCDLFSISKDDPPVLELKPLTLVFALQIRWREACRLRLTLQARGVEADSNVLRIEISWNGRWSDDPTQLATVREV
jgi:hypothetical protein